jgi:hypothetical protein
MSVVRPGERIGRQIRAVNPAARVAILPSPYPAETLLDHPSHSKALADLSYCEGELRFRKSDSRLPQDSDRPALRLAPLLENDSICLSRSRAGGGTRLGDRGRPGDIRAVRSVTTGTAA